MAVHYSFVLPPRTPREIVEAYRTAFAISLADADTRSTVRRMIRSDYEFVDGDDAEKIVVALEKSYSADARVSARLKEIMLAK